MLGKVAVGRGEMTTTDEAAIGTEGTGVRGGKDEVTLAVDILPFALGITTPQHKNQIVTLLIERSDSSIGEFFPTFVLMTAGTVSLYGEGGIE